jgi:hypothetical protein
VVKEHRKHVRTVLVVKAGLYLRLSICKHNAKEVRFILYIITSDGVCMKNDCIATIEEWPILGSHHNIQVILIITYFYMHFIRGFSGGEWYNSSLNYLASTGYVTVQ